jgi:hypothetical protein
VEPVNASHRATTLVYVTLWLNGCWACGTCAGTQEPVRGDQRDDADGVPGNINEVELGAEQLACEPAVLGKCRGYGCELCRVHRLASDIEQS